MMIISEDMDCWPRERTVDAPVCPFAAATGEHLAPAPFNNGNYIGPTIARILEDQTINLHHYLGTSPKNPFPTIGEGYRYDRENNISACPNGSHQGANIVFHMDDMSLATKVLNSLREKFPHNALGCRRINSFNHGGNNGITIFYLLARNPNVIEF